MHRTIPTDDAFPRQALYDGQLVGCSNGLTKREYFAAMALQGLAGKENLMPEAKALTAVLLADQLIKELNKPEFIVTASEE